MLKAYQKECAFSFFSMKTKDNILAIFYRFFLLPFKVLDIHLYSVKTLSLNKYSIVFTLQLSFPRTQRQNILHLLIAESKHISLPVSNRFNRCIRFIFPWQKFPFVQTASRKKVFRNLYLLFFVIGTATVKSMTSFFS